MVAAQVHGGERPLVLLSFLVLQGTNVDEVRWYEGK
jgi:hypothetical protein